MNNFDEVNETSNEKKTINLLLKSTILHIMI